MHDGCDACRICAADRPGLSAAGGALGEVANREGLCELLDLEGELVAAADDLAEPEPRILDLRIHAVHLSDGPGLHDPAERAGEL